ncbi:MAG: diguanylate cyclase [Piscirickettsiaceae bacterium]|nr:diguanylate cyclase [Piscirickettsiaceae bacterium]
MKRSPVEHKQNGNQVRESHDSLIAILDSLEAVVYVADMDTYEVLFANKYAHEHIGNIEGKICWQSIQSDQSAPCSFCTNAKLLTSEGEIAEPYVWDFQNTVNSSWYHIVDRAIQWMDGRIVRIEIAFDITERKVLENKLLENEEKLIEANKKLKVLSLFDGLTNIANRRMLDDYLAKEWSRSLRWKHPFSAIMIDIDFFKQYNDCYGHLVGDDCLKRVAQVLIDVTKRPLDLVSRYGGEEFVILLPETEEVDAIRIAEECCSKIIEQRIPHEKSLISDILTISAGVSTLIPSSDVQPDKLLQTSDKALYWAKEYGRNQVKSYKQEDKPVISK